MIVGEKPGYSIKGDLYLRKSLLEYEKISTSQTIITKYSALYERVDNAMSDFDWLTFELTATCFDEIDHNELSELQLNKFEDLASWKTEKRYRVYLFDILMTLLTWVFPENLIKPSHVYITFHLLYCNVSRNFFRGV